MDQELADAAVYAPDRLHSPDGGTFLRDMASWPPSWTYDVTSEIRLCQVMRIFQKNNNAKFHPDPIWNDGAQKFCEDIEVEMHPGVIV